MPRLPAAVSLAVSLAVVACDSRDPIVMRLAGETVRRSDFDRHVAALGAELEARGFGPLAPEARRGLLESFLEQRALVIEARQRGLVGANASAEQELEAVSRLLASAVATPRVSEQEITAWHARHPAESALPERVTLRQILVGSPNEARDVKRRLAKDPRAFESLARAISKGPEAGLGGYMGAFERGQLPPSSKRRPSRSPTGPRASPCPPHSGIMCSGSSPDRQPARSRSRRHTRGSAAASRARNARQPSGRS